MIDIRTLEGKLQWISKHNDPKRSQIHRWVPDLITQDIIYRFDFDRHKTYYYADFCDWIDEEDIQKYPTFIENIYKDILHNDK